MDVLAGVQYEFKEKNIHLFFTPLRTGSYELLCESNVKLKVKVYDEIFDDFSLFDRGKSKYEYKYARTMLYRKKYIIHIDALSDNEEDKRIYICFKINSIFEPTGGMFKYQWGLLNKENGLDINILPLWKYIKKTSINIGVADTGINYIHESLKERISPFLAYDFINKQKESIKKYCEENDHGTAVAGIIAAVPFNDCGIWGVTENPNVFSLKIFGNDNSNIHKASKVFADAIKYSVEHDIKIINCSFYGIDFSEEEKSIMQEAKDILFVIAAGNKAFDLKYNKVYPACYELDNSIVVAAVDRNGILYSTSNYGEGVDVVAPGEAVVTLYGENGFIKANGTSVATPFVTGVCSLLMQSKPNAKPSEIKKAITDRDNVTLIEGLDKVAKSGGMINAYKAYMSLMS